MYKKTDIELIKISRAKGQNADKAFTEFYERYEKKVYSFIYFNVLDRAVADDLFQETFVHFLDKFDTNATNTNASGYLFKTAYNHCINYHRRKKYIGNFDMSQLISHDTQDIEKVELYDLLLNAIELLDEKFKLPFIMHEIEGMKYKEIAEILEISESLAQTRNYRAKEQVVQILQPIIKDLYI